MKSVKGTLGIKTGSDVSTTCCDRVRVGVPVGPASVFTKPSTYADIEPSESPATTTWDVLGSRSRSTANHVPDLMRLRLRVRVVRMDCTCGAAPASSPLIWARIEWAVAPEISI